MRRVPKLLSVLLFFSVLVLPIFAGGQKEQKTTGKGESKETVELRYVQYSGLRPEDSPVVKDFWEYVEQKFNVKIDLEVWDKNVYQDKLNVMWATRDYPDLIDLAEAKDKILQALENGLFASTLDRVKSNPEFSSRPYKGLMYKGDLYKFPPLSKPAATISIIYRGDWAKKLGIEPPKTPDELLKMAIAFTKDDPDGNGKDDTYGITIIGKDFKFTSPYWQMFVPCFNYQTDTYFIEDGKIKDSIYYADGFKKALKWFRTAYEEGALDPEFLVAGKKDSEAKLLSGQAGMWNKSFLFVPKRRAKLKKNFPNGTLDVLPSIKGDYGFNESFVMKTIFDTGRAFVLKSDKNKNVEKALDVAEYLLSKEGARRLFLGVEGKHYEIKDGKIEWKFENGDKLFNPGLLFSIGIKPPVPYPQMEKDFAIAQTNIKIFESPIPYLAKSEAYKTKHGDLKIMRNTLFAEIIMGKKPVDAYDDFLKQYKANGGDQILEEANKAYQAAK